MDIVLGQYTQIFGWLQNQLAELSYVYADSSKSANLNLRMATSFYRDSDLASRKLVNHLVQKNELERTHNQQLVDVINRLEGERDALFQRHQNICHGEFF
mgnify:CR=1 FL=1